MDSSEPEDETGRDLANMKCVRVVGKDKCLDCATARRGRCINYTRTNPLYVDMNNHDKVDYAVFMMNYNVEHNAEFAGGFADVRQAGENWQSLVGFHLLRRPQKLINLATFCAFLLVIIMIALLIVMFVWNVTLGALIDSKINNEKLKVLFWMIVCLLLIVASSYIIDLVQTRVVDRLENVMYIIK